MRTWLFYKVVETGPVTVVEFCRADERGIHNHFTRAMSGQIEFHGAEPIDQMVKRYAKTCGWVGEPPRAVDDPIAQVVLKGRWLTQAQENHDADRS